MDKQGEGGGDTARLGNGRLGTDGRSRGGRVEKHGAADERNGRVAIRYCDSEIIRKGVIKNTRSASYTYSTISFHL